MKKVALLLAVAVMLVPALAGNALVKKAATAEESTTLTGNFNWEQRDHSGDLEAIFTPVSEGTWDVAFHFEFEGKPHIYTGTATGDLVDGPLAGEVETDGERRGIFTFEGTMEDGKFTGTHASMRDDESNQTGTLTLN